MINYIAKLKDILVDLSHHREIVFLCLTIGFVAWAFGAWATQPTFDNFTKLLDKTKEIIAIILASPIVTKVASSIIDRKNEVK